MRRREGSRGKIKGEAVILGVRDTAESPRDLREELLRVGTTEKKGLTGGALGSVGSGHAGRATWAGAGRKAGTRAKSKGAMHAEQLG